MFTSKNLSVLSLSAVASVALSSAAFAADLGGYDQGSLKDPIPASPYVAPIWNWQGLYFGGNIGYGFDGSDLRSLERITPPPSSIGIVQGFDPEGLFGGVQLGYNWQVERLVFGLETDIQYSDIGDAGGGLYSNNPVFGGGAWADVDWFGTLRGRLGFAVTERVLVYGTAGLAYGGVDFNQIAVNTANGNSVTFQEDGTKVGYTVGGGLEWAIDPNWSMKVEYQYIDLGDEALLAESVTPAGVPTGINYTTGYDLDFHTVRAGLNYKF